MKSLTEHLWFNVAGRRGFVNITSTVEELVRKSGVKEGLCLVNAMHITAAVFINDNESGLLHDYDAWLERLAPHAPTSQYHHNRTGEDNADAHLKRQIMGREVVVASPVSNMLTCPLVGIPLIARIGGKIGSSMIEDGAPTNRIRRLGCSPKLPARFPCDSLQRFSDRIWFNSLILEQRCRSTRGDGQGEDEHKSE